MPVTMAYMNITQAKFIMMVVVTSLAPRLTFSSRGTSWRAWDQVALTPWMGRWG